MDFLRCFDRHRYALRQKRECLDEPFPLAPPGQHTEHQPIESMLLDPKSPERNNHHSGACTAASLQTDAYAISQGKADTEYDASDEAFPEGRESFALLLASLGLPPPDSRYRCCCSLKMHCQPRGSQVTGDASCLVRVSGTSSTARKTHSSVGSPCVRCSR